MSNNNTQLSNDFWFEFDNQFRYDPTSEILNAYQQMGGLNFPIQLFRST